MNFELSTRLKTLGAYAFAEVDREVEKLKAAKVSVIDFGVGDPTVPTPEIVREATQKAVDERACSGYPSYIGSKELRAAIGQFCKRRFGLSLDPETEITSTAGSKEAIFHIHEALLNPGDVVLLPSPGYPPYSRGTKFAEGVPYYYPLSKENGFLPDLKAFPAEVLKKAKAIWVNYPNSPSGALAPDSFYRELIAFGEKHNILLLSDEAYSEMFFTKTPPRSLLEFQKEGVLIFNSLSKRSAMTGYRIGWAMGDSRLVAALRKVKTNLDSGTPTFIQDGAIAALSDEKHVAQMREEYREKRDLLVAALKGCGLPDCSPESTLYIWQKTPKGMDSVEFARRLLDPKFALVTTPGLWLSETLADGTNPGKDYVRFALVPSIEEVKEAAKRLSAWKV